MNNLFNNRYYILASTIAPNPNEVKYWADLASNPNGGDLKYFNGTAWVYVNSKATGDITTLFGEVSSIKTQINTINQNISTLQSTVSSLQSTITSLQSTVDTLSSKVTALEEEVFKVPEEL